jgi:spore coat polysaccharide biosynthesis predicted glycosyltransferase SpsG
MWDFILKSDIAFGAGGTSIWERCCLGLPTITIGIAENQRFALESVHKVGGLYSIGCCKQVPNEKINKAIAYLCSSNDNYFSMVNKSLNICDGQGVNRVCQIMMSNT